MRVIYEVLIHGNFNIKRQKDTYIYIIKLQVIIIILVLDVTSNCISRFDQTEPHVFISVMIMITN